MRFALLLLLLYGLAGAQSLTSLLEQHRADPTDWKLCNQIAIAYTEQQKFEEAAAFYRKVTVLNPAFVPAHKNLAVVLWFAGKRAEATALFRRLVTVIPADPVPHLYLGLAHHEGNEHAKAWKQFSAAGDLALKNPEVLPAAIDSALAVKDKSVPELIARVRDSRDQQAALRTAAVLDRRQMPEQAHALYAHAVEVNPDNEQAYTSIATFAAEHENRRYAIDLLERGLQRMPRSASLLVSHGLLVAIEGERDRAEREFRAAAEINSNWDMPLLALGVLQLETGRTDDAVTTFQNATERFPNESSIHYLYALALSRTGDASTRGSVAGELLKATAITPNDSRSRALLGQTYVAMNRLSEGIAQLKRATELDPRNGTAQYQLGLAYRKLGNTALAEKHMARFRELKRRSTTEQGELVQVLKILK
jgi:tetratricopeptide (TPR) repeat protein